MGWLDKLEDAAVCGDDWAIVELVAQLAPELAPLNSYLVELANKFQFEQILNRVHHKGEGGID